MGDFADEAGKIALVQPELPCQGRQGDLLGIVFGNVGHDLVNGISVRILPGYCLKLLYGKFMTDTIQKGLKQKTAGQSRAA